MQSDVIRAPNGRVITKHYIAKQYSQSRLNNTGKHLDANPKSSICLPAFSPSLLEKDINQLEMFVDELFLSKLDPCFIETVKSRLLKEFSHHPDSNWLRGLALKTKTQWDVYYYFLIRRLLAVSIKHDTIPTAEFSFNIVDEQSGIDSRKLNGLKRAVSEFMNPCEGNQITLVVPDNLENAMLRLNSAGCQLSLNLNTITSLAETLDFGLSSKLIVLYLNDILYRSNLQLKSSDVLLLSVILFMTVIALSPKVGKSG